MVSKTELYQQHEDLRNETNLELQKCFHGIRIFTRHVGHFYKKRHNKKAGTVDYLRMKINSNGMCDDWAVLPCAYGPSLHSNVIIPVHIEIETKSGDAVLNPDQTNWRDCCLHMRWFWFMNRGHEKLIQEIKTELQKRNLTPWIPTKEF